MFARFVLLLLLERVRRVMFMCRSRRKSTLKSKTLILINSSGPSVSGLSNI